MTPELLFTKLEITTIRRPETQSWSPDRSQWQWQEQPAVRITISAEDWATIMKIYQENRHRYPDLPALGRDI